MAPRLRHRFLRLTAAAAVAVAVPVAAALYADYRTNEALEPAWSAALGENVSVGSVRASLTGAVGVEDVAVGGVFRARAVLGAVGLDNLLRGRIEADEVRVVGPQIRDRLHRGRDSRIAAMLARLDARRPRGGAPATDRAAATATRLRRILVNDGQLRVDLFDGGRLVADRVELVPTVDGLRIVTGALALASETPGLGVSGQFERAAADVRLPDLAVTRLLAVGGRFRLAAPDATDATDGPSATFDDVVTALGTDATRAGLVRGHAVGRGDSASFRLELGLDGVVTASLSEIPLGGLTGLTPDGVDVANAVASGAVRVVPGSQSVGVRGRLAIAGASVRRAALSPAPLPLEGEIAGRASVTSGPDGVSVEVGELVVRPDAGIPDADDDAVPPVELTLQGSAAFDTGGALARVDARLELPTTRCMHALLAVPSPARAHLAGLDLSGTIEATARVAFDRTRPDDAEFDIELDASDCDASREPNDADPRDLLRGFTHVRRDGSRAELSPENPDYLVFERMPAVVARAFVAAEDARFFEHRGFDPRQIRNSLAVNLTRGELLRGGSTISQQLVKNVFLSHERTLTRKLEEAVLTWRLEQRLSKQQILERYLNIVELAPGIYGVTRGAEHWFGRPLSRLQPREVAFLAALTPAPSTLSRRIRAAGGVDDAMRTRVDAVLRAMAREGALRRGELARELAAPLRLAL